MKMVLLILNILSKPDLISLVSNILIQLFNIFYVRDLKLKVTKGPLRVEGELQRVRIMRMINNTTGERLSRMVLPLTGIRPKESEWIGGVLESESFIEIC